MSGRYIETTVTRISSDVPQLGVMGAGSMGGRMSLLFAEHGIDVHFFDPSAPNVEYVKSRAKDYNVADKVTHHADYESLCKALGAPKAFVFSTPHGIADETIDGLMPYFKKGDLVMDAGNENWLETERRQKRLEPQGVHYIGMGVSGGYQSARRGPSISPGGTKEALDLAFPFLQMVAAKDKNGEPCVAKLGPGGSGHYVKTLHNGIEQGMMGALAEAWGLMAQGLGMEPEEISQVFAAWNREGPLRDNFLVDIGARICTTKDPKTGEYVLAKVKDKVVQDVDESEGTGVWTCGEIARLHVPGPTITASHLFRVASADARKRELVNKALGGKISPKNLEVDKAKFLNDLRDATYAAFLASFVQGLHVVEKASRENGWNLDFINVLQLWRAGCIIRSNQLVDLLVSVYKSPSVDTGNLLAHPLIAGELTKTYPGLKSVVLAGMTADLNVPSLSATLEYCKYSGYTDMPTSFMEAQLDFFGEHMFDLKSEGTGEPVTGRHHFEWKPATGIHEREG